MSDHPSEHRVIARLAAPAVLTQLGMMAMGVADTMMVSRLGTAAMAATALGHVWVWASMMLALGILMGLDPIVSQAHGARDGARAGRAMQTGLALACLLAVPLGVAWWWTEPALLLLGQDPGLAATAGRYVRIQIPSAPALLLHTVIRQYLTGRAIMTPALWVTWIANVLNVALNWALIFGHLGSAPLGVEGAAIATAVSRYVMLALLVAFLLGGRLWKDAWPGWRRESLSRASVSEVLRYGVPVGIQMALEVWAFNVTSFLAGRIGPEAVAAHTIALTLASVSFMMPLGISTAAATRVGNLVGAREHGRAGRAASAALGMGAGVMILSAVSFTLFRRFLPSLWAPEPRVLDLAAAILPIAACFQIFDGTQVVGLGVLRGMGDTRPAAWFNLLGYWALALPLGAWLAFGLGAGLEGLWWGLTIGLLTVAALLVRRIRTRGPGTLDCRPSHAPV